MANIQEYGDIEGLQSSEEAKQLDDSQSLLLGSLVYLSPGWELSYTSVQQFNRALVYNKWLLFDLSIISLFYLGGDSCFVFF